MFLHACSTRLLHPVSGDVLEVASALPDDCDRLLKTLAARRHAASV
jgi:hypothetical protein